MGEALTDSRCTAAARTPAVVVCRPSANHFGRLLLVRHSRCSVALLRWRSIALLLLPAVVLVLLLRWRRAVVVVILLSWISRHGGEHVCVIELGGWQGAWTRGEE